MTDPRSRRVTVRAEDRTVLLEPAETLAENEAEAVPAESVSYPGLVLTRLHGGVVESSRWLPMGEHPDFADDEHLIAALRAALVWAGDARE